MILDANWEYHCYYGNLLFSYSFINTCLYIFACCNCPFFFCCSNIVPEYSFLDARGLGAYEGKNLEAVSEVTFLFCFHGFKSSE